MPQDFYSQNLQGRSFKGDLSEANFNYANIRGSDFSNTILRGANFSHAQAGLPGHWVIGLLIISLVLAVIAGFSSAIACYFVVSFFLPPNIEEYTIFLGLFVLIGFIVLLIVTIVQGLNASLWTVVVVAGTFAAAGVQYCSVKLRTW